MADRFFAVYFKADDQECVDVIVGNNLPDALEAFLSIAAVDVTEVKEISEGLAKKLSAEPSVAN